MTDLNKLYEALDVADKAGAQDDVRDITALIQESSHDASEFSAPRHSLVSQIPGMPSDLDQSKLEASGATEKSPSLGKKLIGAGEAAGGIISSAVASIPALVPAAVEAVKTIGTGSDAPERVMSEFTRRNSYEPVTPEGKGYMKDVAELVDRSGVVGVAPLAEFTMAGRMVKPAVRQINKALEPEVFAAKKAAGAVGSAASAVLPTISEDAAILAKKAQDLGMEIPATALSDNKFVTFLNGVLQDLPGGAKKQNRLAAESKLIELIGGDTREARLTPRVYGDAMKKSGEGIGEIHAAVDVPLAGKLSEDLAALEAAQELTVGDAPRITNAYINRIRELAVRNKGVLSGTDLKKQFSVLGDRVRAMKKGTEGADTAAQLEELQEIITDNVLAHAGDELGPKLLDLRKKYAIGSTIEPLIAKQKLAGADLSGLQGAMAQSSGGRRRLARDTGGEMGDLSAITQNFMKENAYLSGPEKGLVAGAALALTKASQALLVLGASYPINALNKAAGRGIIKKSLPPFVGERPPVREILEPLNPIVAATPLPAVEGAPPLAPGSGKIPPVPVTPTAGPLPPLLGEQLGTVQSESPQFINPAAEAPVAGKGRIPAGGPTPAAWARAERLAKKGGRASDPALSVPKENSTIEMAGDMPATQPAHRNGDPVNFPLRQETIEQYQSAIDTFRAADVELQKVVSNAINPKVKAEAAKAQRALRREFAAGMKQFGVKKAGDAHGLNRPLYEGAKTPSGRRTRVAPKTQLPVEHTFTMGDEP